MNRLVRYMGVDYGEKRIGLALGDSETKVAIPFKVVENINDIMKIIEEEEVDEIIIGEPLKMSGADLKLSNDFLVFLEKLKKKVNITVRTVDERLTSKAADSLGKGKKNKASRDAVAAMLILQTYLDKYSTQIYK